MITCLSKIFYLLGDKIPFRYSLISFPLYRILMLTSIKCDKHNIVWKNKLNKQTKKNDLIAKLIPYEKRNTQLH